VCIRVDGQESGVRFVSFLQMAMRAEVCNGWVFDFLTFVESLDKASFISLLQLLQYGESDDMLG
jgi:hypothetical protein